MKSLSNCQQTLLQQISGSAIHLKVLDISPTKPPSYLNLTLVSHYHNHPPQLFENLIWMNPQEAADYLRISVNSLRIKVARGEVKPYRLNGCRSLRFKRIELDKLMEASQQRSL